MPGDVFVDANVLVYFRDASEARKQQRASEWMAWLWETRRGRVSFQVLHEFYVTVTQKLRPGMEHQAARRDARNLLVWDPVVADSVMMEGAWALQDRFGLPWWDALIVSAAQVGGCRYLLSEDLQDRQDFAGVRVVDPFAWRPEQLVMS
jgi:predicted nucleic acid-binding protein